MSVVEIIGFAPSVYVRAVRLALEEKAITYRLRPVPPQEGEALALHPFGKIPVMRHGDLVLCESRAIVGYIDDMFEGPPLFPRHPVLRARAEEWISFVNTTIDPVLMRRYYMELLFPSGENGLPDREVIEALLPAMDHHIGVVDRALRQTGWLAGPELSYADLNAYPMLAYVRESPHGRPMIEARPALMDFLERMGRRYSVKATDPESLLAEA